MEVFKKLRVVNSIKNKESFNTKNSQRLLKRKKRLLCFRLIIVYSFCNYKENRTMVFGLFKNINLVGTVDLLVE